MRTISCLLACAFLFTGCSGGSDEPTVMNTGGDFVVQLPMNGTTPLNLTLPSQWKEVSLKDDTVVFAANAPTGENVVIMDQLGNAGTATADIFTQGAIDFFYFERISDTQFKGKLTVQHSLRFYTTRVLPITNKRFVYASCSSVEESSAICSALVRGLAFGE
jgi:hypothetical protein